MGDHIRARRLDRKLFQKDVARIVGADTTSVLNWEKNRVEPEIRFLPAILSFLGYDPRPAPQTHAERIRHFREGRGWLQVDLARHIGTDVSSVSSWETGDHNPMASSLEKLRKVIDLSADSKTA